MDTTMQTAAPVIDSDELSRQVYDTIMATIEPELMLENIKDLDAQYEGETPEEHDARMKRYEEAYKKFDVAFNTFMVDVHGEAKTARRTALQEQEAVSKQSDQPVLESIEAAFS